MEARKDDNKKAPIDLVPPEAIIAIAEVLAFGAEKYDRHNWRNGLDHSRMVAALLRHLMAYQMGIDNDPDSGLSHLAHMACNAVMLVASVESGLGNDDRWMRD